jgi:hypothetical protein
MQILIEQISSELECPVCFSATNEKKILLCHHSLCTNCVTTMISKQNIQCPICRAVTKIDQIKTDWFKNEINNIITNSCGKNPTDDIQQISTKPTMPLHVIPKLEIHFSSINTDFRIKPFHGYPCKIHVGFSFIIICDTPRWVHTYGVYTTDNWKTTHRAHGADIEPREKKYFISGAGAYVDICDKNPTKLSFAICIYDDFKNYHWDNNYGKNHSHMITIHDFSKQINTYRCE